MLSLIFIRNRVNRKLLWVCYWANKISLLYLDSPSYSLFPSFLLNFHPLLAPGQLISHRIDSCHFRNPESRFPALSSLEKLSTLLSSRSGLNTLKGMAVHMSLRTEILGRNQRLPRDSGKCDSHHPQQRLMGADQTFCSVLPAGTEVTSLSSSSSLMVMKMLKVWRPWGLGAVLLGPKSWRRKGLGI